MTEQFQRRKNERSDSEGDIYEDGKIFNLNESSF